MNLLRYLILILMLWGLDSYLLVVIGESVGSNISYGIFLLLLIYFFLSRKRKLVTPLLLLGFTYFVISGLIYIEDYKFYVRDFIKYFILIICGAELARDTSAKELTYILAGGTLSILIHAVFFGDPNGRYSGFYLNPNGAAFVCLLGYCLAFKMKNNKIRYLLIFLFTFSGLLTFSRFFFLMWLLVTIISAILDKKNVKILSLGIGAVLLLVASSALLELNTDRFSLIESGLNNNIKTQEFMEDDRFSTWSNYYDQLMLNPIFGNGYKSFHGVTGVKVGVHNTYLMVLGEAGIIPLLTIIFIYISMVKLTLNHIRPDFYMFLMAISLTAILLTMHNYFKNMSILFFSIWVYTQLEKQSKENEHVDTI